MNSCGKWMEEAKDNKVRGLARMEGCDNGYEYEHGKTACKLLTTGTFYFLPFALNWFDCADCPLFTPRPQQKGKTDEA